MIDEVYLWHADNHQSLLQIDTITFDVRNHACPKYPE